MKIQRVGSIKLGNWIVPFYGSLNSPLFLVSDLVGCVGYNVGGANNLAKKIKVHKPTLMQLEDTYGRGAWVVNTAGAIELLEALTKPSAKDLLKHLKAFEESNRPFLDKSTEALVKVLPKLSDETKDAMILELCAKHLHKK